MKQNKLPHVNKHSVFYNTMILAVSSIFLQLLGFVYRIILSRMTGAEGMGMFSLVMPTYSVLSAFTISGITMTVSRLTAEKQAVGDTHGVRKIVQASSLLFLVLFLICGVVFSCSADFIAEVLLGDLRVNKALLLLVPCLLLTGFENIFKSYFYGTNKVVQPIISEVIEQLVRIVAVFVLLVVLNPQHPSNAVVVIILAMVISEMVSASVMTVFYKRQVAKSIIPPSNKQNHQHYIRTICAIALPVSVAGTLNTVLHSINTILIPQRLVVSGMSATEAISVFGVLVGMTMPLLALPGAIIFPLTTVLIPRIARGVTLQKTALLKRKVAKAIHVTSLISMPFVAIMIPLGKAIAMAVYKQPDAGHYIVPLSIAMLFSFYQVIANAILNAMGLQKRVAISVVALAFIQLGFTWFAVALPHVRLGGFVLGVLICSLLGALISTVWMVKKIKVKMMWLNWFVLPLICAAISGFCARFIYVISINHGMNDIGAIVCGIVVAMLFYGITLRFSGINFIRYMASICKNEKN